MIHFASCKIALKVCFACCGAVQRVVQEFAGQVQVEVQGRRNQGDQLLLLLCQDRPQEELAPRSCNIMMVIIPVIIIIIITDLTG